MKAQKTLEGFLSDSSKYDLQTIGQDRALREQYGPTIMNAMTIYIERATCRHRRTLEAIHKRIEDGVGCRRMNRQLNEEVKRLYSCAMRRGVEDHHQWIADKKGKKWIDMIEDFQRRSRILTMTVAKETTNQDGCCRGCFIPPAKKRHQGIDQYVLGLTAGAAADLLRLTDFFASYERDDNELASSLVQGGKASPAWMDLDLLFMWGSGGPCALDDFSFTGRYGPTLTIYDLCQHIKTHMENHKAQKFSVAQVLKAEAHPGVGKADAWMTCSGLTNAHLLVPMMNYISRPPLEKQHIALATVCSAFQLIVNMPISARPSNQQSASI